MVPDYLESAYEECLCREFETRNISFERQLPLPLEYKGKPLDCGYRLDLLDSNTIVVELKAVSLIKPIHEAQLLTYMKLGGVEVGIADQFQCPSFEEWN